MKSGTHKIPFIILRTAVAIILLSHSIPGMLDGGVYHFGEYYLNTVGFKPYGVLLAWIIKLSHVLCALLLLLNRWVITACIAFIFILIMGIILVHFKEGWFVVGGGRNGAEYNVLQICVLISICVDQRKPSR